MFPRTRLAVPVLTCVLAAALAPPPPVFASAAPQAAPARPETTPLLGAPLYAVELAPAAKKTAEDNLEKARMPFGFIAAEAELARIMSDKK